MKNIQLHTDKEVIKTIHPLQFGQVIAGLEMEDTDELLLHYIYFLSGLIPIHTAHFLHVVPELVLYYPHFEDDIPDVSLDYSIDDMVLAKMTERVQRNLSKRSKMDIHCNVKEGSPLEILLHTAEDIEADLLIIGQKNKTNSHGILAKMLARRTKCNALVVPEMAKHKLNKILVPIDFSAHSVKALQNAVAMKKQIGDKVEIVCLNVYELPNFASFEISRTRDQFRRMIERDRLDAFNAFLHTHVPEEKDQIEKVVLQKDLPWIPAYIMNYAQENEIDFIVMGAKGHSKLERLLLGSVTEHLLTSNKSIPTLIVK